MVRCRLGGPATTRLPPAGSNANAAPLLLWRLAVEGHPRSPARGVPHTAHGPPRFAPLLRCGPRGSRRCRPAWRPNNSASVSRRRTSRPSRSVSADSPLTETGRSPRPRATARRAVIGATRAENAIGSLGESVALRFGRLREAVGPVADRHSGGAGRSAAARREANAGSRGRFGPTDPPMLLTRCTVARADHDR